MPKQFLTHNELKKIFLLPEIEKRKLDLTTEEERQIVETTCRVRYTILYSMSKRHK